MGTPKRGQLELKVDTAIRAAFLDEITTDEALFQPRNPEAYKYPEKVRRDSQDHVKALADALERQNGRLEPIILFKREKCVNTQGDDSGSLVVLEGHHRLKAYKLYQKRTEKPRVQVYYRLFEGSLAEAKMLARTSNVKQSLNMTKGEATENAWRVVIDLKGNVESNRALGTLLGVSEGTIRKQRKAYETHFRGTKPDNIGLWKEVTKANWNEDDGLSGDAFMRAIEDKGRELKDSEWMDELLRVCRKDLLHRLALADALDDALRDYGFSVSTKGNPEDEFLDDDDELSLGF